MNLAETINIVTKKINEIEAQIFQGDYSNIVIELICKNDKNNEIKNRDLKEISSIGCEDITKDINIVNKMFRPE